MKIADKSGNYLIKTTNIDIFLLANIKLASIFIKRTKERKKERNKERTKEKRNVEKKTNTIKIKKKKGMK